MYQHVGVLRGTGGYWRCSGYFHFAHADSNCVGHESQDTKKGWIDFSLHYWYLVRHFQLR